MKGKKRSVLQKLADNGFDSISILLTIMVILLILFAIRQDQFFTIPKYHNSNYRFNRNLQKQTINLIASDRIHNHLSRLIETPQTESISIIEAKNAYKQLPKRHQSLYINKSLHTNDSHEHGKITKHLIRSSYKIKGVKYHSNIAEISLGHRYFAHNDSLWHPWHRVTTSYGLSMLVNKRMMRTSKLINNQRIPVNNLHRKHILSPKADSMGVFSIYNKKLNLGVLVETFRK